MLKDAKLGEVVSRMTTAHDLPESLKVAAWDLRLAGCGEAERRTVVDEFSRSFRADQPGGLEAARWLLRHREFEAALKWQTRRCRAEKTGSSWAWMRWRAKGIGRAYCIGWSLRSIRRLRLRWWICSRSGRVVSSAKNPMRSKRGVACKPSSTVSLLRCSFMWPGMRGRWLCRSGRCDLPWAAGADPDSDGMHTQLMERRHAYLGLLRNASATMTLDELTGLYTGLVHEFPDMDEARNDLCYLQALQNKADRAVTGEVTRLLDRQPALLTVRSTLALALLREGRAQAAADVYAGWQIDWASASDRCKAVRVAVLDAAGQHAAAEQMRSALVAANLRVEEKRLAGMAP